VVGLSKLMVVPLEPSDYGRAFVVWVFVASRFLAGLGCAAIRVASVGFVLQVRVWWWWWGGGGHAWPCASAPRGAQ
jgi:hypothetical protein